MRRDPERSRRTGRTAGQPASGGATAPVATPSPRLAPFMRLCDNSRKRVCDPCEPALRPHLKPVNMKDGDCNALPGRQRNPGDGRPWRGRNRLLPEMPRRLAGPGRVGQDHRTRRSARPGACARAHAAAASSRRAAARSAPVYQPEPRAPQATATTTAAATMTTTTITASKKKRKESFLGELFDF